MTFLNLFSSLPKSLNTMTSNLIDRESIFHFEKLKVYQKSLDFVDWTYRLIKSFPIEENYRLSSQFIRASHSVALNIAEGSAGTSQEFQYFLRISLRSLRECVFCIEIASRQKYLNEQETNHSREMAAEISKMIIGLMKSIDLKNNK